VQEEEAKGNSMAKTAQDAPDKELEFGVWLHHQHTQQLSEAQEKDRRASMLHVG